jgi:hypothetical protein
VNGERKSSNMGLQKQLRVVSGQDVGFFSRGGKMVLSVERFKVGEIFLTKN